MTTTAITSPGGVLQFIRSIWGWIKKIPPVYPVFFIIFIVLGLLNPIKYQSMNGIMTFLRTASPLAVIAVGEMLVLALGGFDLSVGAIVTFVVLVSSKLLANDPANAYSAILIMFGFGIAIGLVNGLAVSYLKVPSFIVTLGTLSICHGIAFSLTGGKSIDGIPRLFVHTFGLMRWGGLRISILVTFVFSFDGK